MEGNTSIPDHSATIPACESHIEAFQTSGSSPPQKTRIYSVLGVQQ